MRSPFLPALAPRARLAALLLASLALSSCARELPTAPRGLDHARAAAPATGGAAFEDEVVVTLASPADAGALAVEYGAELVGQHETECALLPATGQSAQQLATSLATDPRVLTSETNTVLESPEARQESFAFDDGQGVEVHYREQAAAEAIHLSPAHVVTRGAGITVAILDTGVDPAHPALAGRIAGGWDFVQNDGDPTDAQDGLDNDADGRVDEAYGHGTHVAGIVALTAPETRLLVVRVLDADGRGDVLAVASGIRWAVANGAKVINMSLGMLRSSDAIHAALEEAETMGILYVASAGNWGGDTPQEYPARSSDVNAVAATDASRRPATFTSFGSFVALSAPGVAIRSAYPGGGYRLWSGTSMSSPFVAGAAALLFSQHPGWDPDQVRSRLRSTAQPIVGTTEPQNGKLGAGMLDVGAAVGVHPGDAGGQEPGERVVDH